MDRCEEPHDPRGVGRRLDRFGSRGGSARRLDSGATSDAVIEEDAEDDAEKKPRPRCSHVRQRHSCRIRVKFQLGPVVGVDHLRHTLLTGPK